jgi:DNA (cytosine-5)-methyltransferase 1
MEQRRINKLLERVSFIFTQQVVADHLGVSREEVNRWLKGRVNVPDQYEFGLREMLPQRPKHYEKPDFTFIDLFAGIGGIRKGFETAGGACVFTSEWDAYAQRTYAANHYLPLDEDIAGDITKVNPADIPDHDVLLAGFPCQPFSIAGVSKKNSLGRKHGFEDATQGTLFFNVAKILAEKGFWVFTGLRNLDKARSLQQETGGNTTPILLDVTKEDSIISAATQVAEVLSQKNLKLLGIINNACHEFHGPLELLPIEFAPQEMEVSYLGSAE